MKKTLGLLFLSALLAGPSIAQKITIDYAKDFDFSSAKTFAYVAPSESTTGNQLTDGRIEAAVLREMRDGQLTQVDSDADLYVTWHTTSQDNTVLNTTNMGYGGYGPGWGGYGRYGYGYGGYGGGMSSSTTTTSTYTEGTLIIDAYEPTEKKLVWRGTGTVTVKDNPEKAARQIDKILAKMDKKWEKILANRGK